MVLVSTLLLVVCGLAPGFFFVRRLRWRPLEKLCGAVGLSFVLLYLAAWGIFCFGPADGWAHTALYAAVAAVCVAMAIASWRDAARLFRPAAVRSGISAYAFLLVWTLVMLAAIRVYSGAKWSSDWLEHFQRSLFFLYRWPAGTPILGNYLLPARPPMMNVVAAFFLALTGDRFENFQIVFAFLNLLPVLACWQLLRGFAGPRRARILPLVILFALNPVMMEAATYTWTKAFAAFYVLLAVHFYLSGWRKRDGTRIAAAFLSLAAGMLAHYSAGPYIVFFALHYLVAVFRARPARWRELATIVAECGLLLATWFGWSVATFGTKGTLASNTSVTSSRQYEGHNLEKIAGNLVDTVAPAALRDPGLLDTFAQPNRLGRLRDDFFISYQPNLLLGMGLVGGIVALWLYWRRLRRRTMPREVRRFWAALVPFVVVLGVASAGERDFFGVAHLTLLPLTLMGLTLLAAEMMTRRALAVALLCGCAVDFGFGVWLHMHVESLENTPRRTVFRGLEFHGAGASIATPGPDSLSQTAWINWLQKHQYALAGEWLAAMRQRSDRDPGFAQRAQGVMATLEGWRNEDQALWHGWFSRHGGSAELLGDAVGEGGNTAAEWLLAIGALALMAAAVREIRRVPAAVPAATPAIAPAKVPKRRLARGRAR